jgi:1,2-phenylacetyl-CoA epoxidase catalytic subunit
MDDKGVLEENLEQEPNSDEAQNTENEPTSDETQDAENESSLQGELDTTREMQRFYTLAKRQAWKVEQLSWGQIPPVPEGKGSSEKRARRMEIWRSVVTQQLQADTLASLLSSQLLAAAPDLPGRLYYTTMVQDEGRHAEAWLKLVGEVGGMSEPNPHLVRLGELTMNADTIEEKVWFFQVIFEGLVIDKFRQIASAAPNTVLAELCNRLTIDDGVHHGAGVSYEQHLLRRASPRTKRAIERMSLEMWPLYAEHLLWRPNARSWANSAMHARDIAALKDTLRQSMKLARKVGLNIDLPPLFSD